MFRAVARGLAERTVLTVTPGTTASGFATRAGAAFDAEGALVSDEVRERLRRFVGGFSAFAAGR